MPETPPTPLKTLVVAEKPSVGREIAKVLGVRGGGRGSIEGPGHVVTWAVGHLVGIAEPEEQDPAWAGRWSLSQLPILPRRFKLRVLDKTADQYETIKALLLDPRIGDIVNATDAGREGELIFRRIYLLAGCAKPVRRLWASDMTEAGLKKALDAAFPDEHKRNLGLAAFARAEADWLIGMNFSRLFTVLDRDLVTVGRVQTPVLKLLADRRREIENFAPRDYWTVDGTFEREGERFSAQRHNPPEFSETRLEGREQAEAIAARGVGQEGAVDEVKSRKGSQKPPLLFDLTTLQREANTRHGFSAQDTLTIAQGLYESRKALTYPRTDSRHLTREIFKEILDHLRAVHHHFPDITPLAAERIKKGGKFACVDDKKVTDHHAIIPTARKIERRALDDREWAIYEMVCRRTLAAFLPDATFAATTAWIAVQGERFKATGKVFADRGWLTAEPWRAAEDNPLPRLRKGSRVLAAEVAAVAHQTKPPQHFTDASLLAAMETAGKLVEDEELAAAMKDRGLGTPATRAATIENLLGRGYVDKQGKRLVCSDRGLHVVDTVSGRLPEVASPEMTGEWEKRLKDIEQGKDTYPAFMRDIRAQVARGVELVARPGRRPQPAPQRQDAATPAPQDGPHRDEAGAEALPAARKGERAAMSDPRPDAAARESSPGPDGGVEKGRKAPVSGPESAAPAAPPEPVGTCPLCKGVVYPTPTAYACANFLPEHGGCGFSIPRTFRGGTVTEDHARDLLSKGRTFKRVRLKTRSGQAQMHLRLNRGKLEAFFRE